ncbi:26S rRNA (cytosine-C(5))-methyltransferase nsun-1-like isoform X1 [Eriocheir sinensis]|uniref:26S rRNA (cytosine-C(5))-methyltransferase nsun-1-like isoform X1 n=1 Tax=Eriocheir sinensis TaxID=95602 RepID=UPI0021C6D98D|nr:26S rRNA (cytosine-C(5))-methyltransferase nsun-1-like isoform X1 [Eriocheir sinensis]XP_050715214.1 26S rRNA (cytosine-C(5))-methyltransferase nsun-1-like isoform X1 [Eriocheir sinensis]
MPQYRSRGQSRSFLQGQGRRGGQWFQSQPKVRSGVAWGHRRAGVTRDVSGQQVLHYKALRTKREWYLFKRKMQFEIDKLDDLIQDFGSLLDKPFTKPASPLGCSLYLPGPHNEGPQKTLKELSEESGLSLDMLGCMTQVMSRQEAARTFEAIAFMPPVTFLRINTLKTSPKRVWEELVEGDVNAWLPRWSNITMLAAGDPNDPCPLIRNLLAEGQCSMQRERQWQEITIPLKKSEEHPEHLRNKGTGLNAPPNTLERLSLFYSAHGSISSLLLMVLAAKDGEDVLELCATNSGKTPHIAAMQMNSGRIVANTLQAQEVEAMMESNERHDVRNCVITNIEPSLLAKQQRSTFHRVLVDAPSSGVGIVRLAPGARVCQTAKELNYISMQQKQLLLNGADCVKKDTLQNSYLVYTTCSTLVEENEAVVQHLLENRPQFRLVPTSLDIGHPGVLHYKSQIFHEDMGYTQRIYCHQYHMDGAFIAKLAHESNVNVFETSATQKLIQKQAEHKADQNTNMSSSNEKDKAKHTPAKTKFKKGSLEWLKHTFMGDEKIDEDYSDEDYC